MTPIVLVAIGLCAVALLERASRIAARANLAAAWARQIALWQRRLDELQDWRGPSL